LRFARVLEGADFISYLHLLITPPSKCPKMPNQVNQQPQAPSSFRSNLISGVFLSLTSIPQICTYSHLLGVTPLHALLTSGPPLIAFSLVTTNANLMIGVTAVTAVLTKNNLEYSFNNFSQDTYVSHVGCFSFLTGVTSIVLALMQFSSLAHRVPASVKAGFKWGCSMSIFASGFRDCVNYNKSTIENSQKIVANSIGTKFVMPIFSSIRRFNSDYIFKGKMKMSGSAAIEKLALTLTNTDYYDFEPLFVFFISIYICKKGRKFLPKRSPKGLEVILSTALGTLFSFVSGYASRGGAIVGKQDINTDSILPDISFHNPLATFTSPSFLSNFESSLLHCIYSATVFSAVNFLSIVAINSHLESIPELGFKWKNPRRDLLAQGVGCIASGIIGGGPIGGSLSRSLVSLILGATSFVSTITTGTILFLLVNFVGGLLTFTPIVTLAAMVVAAVGPEVLLPKSIFDLKFTREKVTAWATGISTMLYNPVYGFSIGIMVAVATELVATILLKSGKKKKIS